MNKNNASQYLPLVQALAEGIPIQYHVGGDCWQDEPNPSFAQLPERFRVAPNPYQHLIDALDEGKVVEFKQFDGLWIPTSSNAANFTNLGIEVLKGVTKDTSSSYRIKPEEPKTIWVNKYQGYNYFYTSEQAARNAVGATAKRVAVKYVEVKE